jgi:RNA polymerase sigma-70 factor, ECF subfamily
VREVSIPNRETNQINKDKLLEKIMIEHGNDVLYLAYSYVKDRTVAEDIAQEVFISAYTHLETFNWNSSIKTWLYRITVNRCKDYLKSWSYRTNVLTNVIDFGLKSRVKETDTIIIERDEQAKLLDYLLTLPLKYREVIYLFYFEELSTNEIAQLLSINLNTLKSRLKRAKELLKKGILKGGL